MSLSRSSGWDFLEPGVQEELSVVSYSSRELGNITIMSSLYWQKNVWPVSTYGPCEWRWGGWSYSTVDSAKTLLALLHMVKLEIWTLTFY